MDEVEKLTTDYFPCFSFPDYCQTYFSYRENIV